MPIKRRPQEEVGKKVNRRGCPKPTEVFQEEGVNLLSAKEKKKERKQGGTEEVISHERGECKSDPAGPGEGGKGSLAEVISQQVRGHIRLRQGEENLAPGGSTDRERVPGGGKRRCRKGLAPWEEGGRPLPQALLEKAPLRPREHLE